MSNLFLFRHGIYSKGSGELTSIGKGQARDAGKIIGEKLNQRLDVIRSKRREQEECFDEDNEFDLYREFEGLIKVHSTERRTKQFLEIAIENAEKEFKLGVGLGGESVIIESGDIFRKCISSKDILRIIKDSVRLGNIYIIVGHSPGTAYVANHYVEKEGFEYQGKEYLLKGTPEGHGYWINTIMRNVEPISPT
jgi:hypothetical protein